MQIHTNKHQTICRRNDLKLRKENVISSCRFLWRSNAIQRNIHDFRVLNTLRDIFWVFRTLLKDGLKATSYLCKDHHHRYLAGFWIRLGFFSTERTRKREDATPAASLLTQDCSWHYLRKYKSRASEGS